MINNRLVKMIKQGKGYVAIMAGSDSDDEAPKPEKEGDKPKPSHIEQIVRGIEAFEIPYGVHIASAHKQSKKLDYLISEYNKLNHPILIVGVAGGTDALSGTASWASNHPVVSSPPDAPNESCVNNPPGSSNAYIARPGNVGRFAVQMFSHLDPKYQKLFTEFNKRKIDRLQLKDGEIGTKFLDRMTKNYGGK